MRSISTKTIAVLVASAAVASSASAQFVQHVGTTAPDQEGWLSVEGTTPWADHSFPISTPEAAWRLMNTGDVYPRHLPAFRSNFSPTVLEDLGQRAWRIKARLAIENSVPDPLHPDPDGRQGGAALLGRFYGCYVDLWFSTVGGKLAIQRPVSSSQYGLTAPVIVPPLKTPPWFDIEVLFTKQTQTCEVRIDGAPVPGLNPFFVRSYFVKPPPGDLGVTFGIFSDYAMGEMSVASLTFEQQLGVFIDVPRARLCSSQDRTLRLLWYNHAEPNATFLWLHNGAVIPGATSDTLVVHGSEAGAEGTYACIVGTDLGVFSSSCEIVICRVDRNCDGRVDLSDFFQFFDCFATGEPCSDIDGSGQVDLGDFFMFFDLWDQGICDGV